MKKRKKEREKSVEKRGQTIKEKSERENVEMVRERQLVVNEKRRETCC